ncbi:unnamed protein product [Somion occarium]|uniref:Uncharacterized protein n=1 Tax=Somion occarium TaxID=3059160 RepID=A0ABP1DBV0_9APHY
MTFPTCPPFKHADELPSEASYFDHLTNTMAWFSIWALSGIERLHALIPITDLIRNRQAHQTAKMQWNQDPIVGGGVVPSTRDHRKAYFDRCKEMSTREIRTPVDAVLRTFYAMSYIQVCLMEVFIRHPNDSALLASTLSTYKQKRLSDTYDIQALDRSLVFDERPLTNLLDRIGEKFTYWDDALQEVFECEIVNGGGDVGEEWFSINKTMGGQTDEDVITARQLEALLSSQI